MQSIKQNEKLLPSSSSMLNKQQNGLTVQQFQNR